MEKLSVITICFNNLEELISTCLSVDCQSMHPYEHIIIDGSSDSNIAEWLNNIPQPGYRKWICENDNGISDAFNKGIKYSTGTIIHLLNSADTYYSNDIIESVMNIFEINPDIQWISGKIFMNRGGIWVNIGAPFNRSLLFKGMRSVSHPTWFLRKNIYDRVGLFSTEINIAMDYDLLCRIRNEKYFYFEKTIVRFDDKGLSTIRYLQSLDENNKIYESYFGFSFKSRIWKLRLKFIYYLMQTKFGKWLYAIKMS